MIKKISFLITLTLITQTAMADNNIQLNTQDTNIQSVIDAFTNCDNSFFHQLKANAQDFDGIAYLAIKDDIAYIPVKDITANEGNTHLFTRPIQYRGLTITAYKNIYVETPFLGQYYYWGFVVDGSIDNAKQTLNQLPWQPYSKVSYAANAKLNDRQIKNSGWQNNPYSIDGVIPRSSTVEKSLYLEAINENQVQLTCSIQGDMDSDLLYTIRPDMRDIDQDIKVKRQAEIDKIKEQKRLKELQNNSSTLADAKETDKPVHLDQKHLDQKQVDQQQTDSTN